MLGITYPAWESVKSDVNANRTIDGQHVRECPNVIIAGVERRRQCHHRSVS